jgi:hypothetical protein
MDLLEWEFIGIMLAMVRMDLISYGQGGIGGFNLYSSQTTADEFQRC